MKITQHADPIGIPLSKVKAGETFRFSPTSTTVCLRPYPGAGIDYVVLNTGQIGNCATETVVYPAEFEAVEK